jgi:hypothetical protein
MYYYFRKRNNQIVDILSFDHKINTLLNRWLVPLTDDQVDFYIDHPAASILEVQNCALTPMPTIDVQEYIAGKIEELRAACMGSIKVSLLEYAMAEDKVNNITAESYYSPISAQQKIKDFRSQSKHAMEVFATYSERMGNAVSVEDVDDLYVQAMSAL